MQKVFLVAALLVAVPSDWKIAEPVQKADKHLSSHVKMSGNKIVLENRGTLLSALEYPNGVVSHFRWKYTGGHDKYHEQLAFAAFTTGQQPQWSFEVTDGILVRFNSAGALSIERRKGPGDGESLKSVPMQFEKDRWYDIVIIADRTKMTVYVDGKLAAQVDMPAGLEGTRIALYNRESVANVYQKSIIENFVTHPYDGKEKRKRKKK